jgi:thymidylate synthase (FAD)
MTGKIDVFNDGKSFVRLVETGGDELSIVNAARVSLHNESEWVEQEGKVFSSDKSGHTQIWIQGDQEKVLSNKDKGLIKFLLKNKHGSPFEHNFFAFHIRLPIFVMREWVRHRIGFSVNEESGRYVEMRPDFYIPTRARKQEGKPGAYTFEHEDEDTPLSEHTAYAIENASSESFASYTNLLHWGIAKEQARIVLPLNLYTECRWTCNARSLMNFVALRNSEDSMWEIGVYAEVIEEIFAQKMPTVHDAFIDNERVAP